MVIDERLAKSLHVRTLRHAELHAEREPHVLFQASTIGALLDGAYEGDVSLGELGEHGDFGLGTINALDGELIALEGRFYRADAKGGISVLSPATRTPFAVIVPFQPALHFELGGPLSHEQLLSAVEAQVRGEAPAFALRIDGDFESVRARSVPRQHPPYRPLTDVIAEQTVFELADVAGTMVGFRFPDHGHAVEVPGYHLHFISADRTVGGHVLDCRSGPVAVAVDASSELRVELPPGVDLGTAALDSSVETAVQQVEHQG